METWVFWLVGSIFTLVGIMSLINIIGGNDVERQEAMNLISGLIGGVLTVVGFALFMAFVFKPAIQFIIDLF